jgi:hypothetical protein
VADLDEPAAQHDNLDDGVGQYIDDYDSGGFMAPLDEPYRAPDTRELGPAEKTRATKRLFGSQGTPPAGAFTENQTARAAILSPNTLLNAAGEVLGGPSVPFAKPKKG